MTEKEQWRVLAEKGPFALSRSQKDLLIWLYRNTTWFAKWPLRAWRRGTIETRLPPIPGRRWRSSLTPAQHVALINGAMKYTYRGIRMIKHPVEIALYTKLLWELMPRTVIEIGSKDGGTATWLGDMVDVFDLNCSVVSIDLHPPRQPWCVLNGVKFLQGDERNLGPLKAIFAEMPHPWFVINDASHNAPAMLQCFEFLHGFMQSGDYLVVEDGFLTEAGLDWDGQRKGGPAQAIAEFLQKYRGLYEVDARYCDHFGTNVTSCPNGYLRRL